jgi:hypothetical protein
MNARHTSSLCQTCYEQARPDRYFPETFRDGTCCACGDYAFVARVTKGEAQQVAYSLFATPADRPACCRVAA